MGTVQLGSLSSLPTDCLVIQSCQHALFLGDPPVSGFILFESVIICSCSLPLLLALDNWLPPDVWAWQLVRSGGPLASASEEQEQTIKIFATSLSGTSASYSFTSWKTGTCCALPSISIVSSVGAIASAFSIPSFWGSGGCGCVNFHLFLQLEL